MGHTMSTSPSSECLARSNTLIPHPSTSEPATAAKDAALSAGRSSLHMAGQPEAMGATGAVYGQSPTRASTACPPSETASIGRPRRASTAQARTCTAPTRRISLSRSLLASSSGGSSRTMTSRLWRSCCATVRAALRHPHPLPPPDLASLHPLSVSAAAAARARRTRAVQQPLLCVSLYAGEVP